MKKFLKILLIVLLVIVVLAVGLFAYLTITEFKPAPVEKLDVLSDGSSDNAPRELKILSWNVGYAGLGKESDFFMDGGTHTASADEATVNRYLSGIRGVIDGDDYDFVMLQEVDTNSSRTYGIDETKVLSLSNSVHALNYSCNFVPFPLPPIGRVNSGLFTTSDHAIESAERISLPCPFSWPVSTANLKRCLLVSYVPVEGSDKYLVLVNLHLEAYDDGEGKIAQTKQLNEFIENEYAKGNYVIAGGDFNQVFPDTLSVYPNEHPDLWAVGALTEDVLPEGFTFAFDPATPTCRLLNQPYDPSDTANTQYYVIDGMILSPNVELNGVETLDEGFENSDHNPVALSVTLK